jgi:hypothetical protein
MNEENLFLYADIRKKNAVTKSPRVQTFGIKLVANDSKSLKLL